ncbi:hypothetical protein [Mucilaginibacter sp.]|uniref:LIC_13387 family protein n=1 Tax=Mucilaginibacter sp. TaxID=1882438 RepID=UPI0025E3EACF|nr:hypothetical protein [Mucilaginibacter sp.]
MKPKILLRIASILMLLHTAGHTMGALTWNDAPNAAVAQVVKGMETVHFGFMGRQVTLALFFNGYGFIMIGVLLLISALLWFLSGDAANNLFGRFVGLLSVFLLAMAVLEYVYFFAFAAAFSALAGVCTLAALYFRDKI